MNLTDLSIGQTARISEVGGEERLDSIFWIWVLYRARI